MLSPVYIPNLVTAPNRQITIKVQEFLPDLETLTPVLGMLQVTHCGNYLEVKAQAETIVTLTCDRCLQQFNHRLLVNTTELIWLEEPTPGAKIPLEQEVELEALVETLPPQGYFHPEGWLYEHLCLEFPQRQLCDGDCPGIPIEHPEPGSVIDRRWAALEKLKQQLSQ